MIPKKIEKFSISLQTFFCGEYTIEPQLEKKDKSLHYRWGYSIVYPDILSFQPLGSTNTKNFSHNNDKKRDNNDSNFSSGVF